MAASAAVSGLQADELDVVRLSALRYVAWRADNREIFLIAA